MDKSLEAPGHTTLSRRSKSLRVNLAVKQTDPVVSKYWAVANCPRLRVFRAS